MKKYVEKIFKHREDFIIIGLTGKTGSGCSTIAKILSDGYVEYEACDANVGELENRKNSIIKKFVSKKFINHKFKIIKPSTLLIMLFIFEKKIIIEFIKNIYDSTNIDLEKIKTLKKIYQVFTSFNINNINNDFLPELISKIEDIEQDRSDTKITAFKDYILDKKDEYETKLLEETIDDVINEINRMFDVNLNCSTLKQEHIVIEEEYIPVNTSSDNRKENFLKKFNKKRIIFEKSLHYLAKHQSQKFIETYTKFNDAITEKRNHDTLTIPILQEIGDLVRNEMDIFQLPLYIQLLIKAFTIITKPCYLVIDSLKNPFEILYFKERYSAFYTFSIHARDEVIYERYSSDKLNDIIGIHKRELFKDGTNKTKDSLESKKDFNSQNIIECIQRSDIYIDNNKDKTDTLYRQVFKYLSLIIHPGLVTPSHDEVIMQLALNAKLNSGCISRQVGAVVLNKYGSIKAIGWNDVPEGQTPCLLRSHAELLNNSKLNTYSTYEQDIIRKSVNFEHIFSTKKSSDKQYEHSTALGLNDSFCFKGIKNKIDNDKNQVYTRSLHAEENAFLQASKYGNSEIIEGQLFTTSSPCFLCAKKAYQLGMKRIVYIEAYPDISNQQVFNIGALKIEMVHFRGAIGMAYHKLYEPIFSYKDELKALNS